MRLFKTAALAAMLTIGAFATVTYSSCKKDDCKDVSCANGGTCADGRCFCPTGYEGGNCGDEVRRRYTNKYYRGNGVDSEGETYPLFLIAFTTENTTNGLGLEMGLLDNQNRIVLSLPVTLTSNNTFSGKISLSDAVLEGYGTVDEDEVNTTMIITSYETGVEKKTVASFLKMRAD